MTDLPSIEQCHEFMNTINAGRKALGLEPIDKLEYDSCDPGNPRNCLSARHLFVVVGEGRSVGSNTAGPFYDEQTRVGLATAIESEPILTNDVVIPDTILAVTDPFDSTRKDEEDWHELRNRLAEAGLVD